MGTMVQSLLWVMQDLYHQPYHGLAGFIGFYDGGAPACIFRDVTRSHYDFPLCESR